MFPSPDTGQSFYFWIELCRQSRWKTKAETSCTPFAIICHSCLRVTINDNCCVRRTHLRGNYIMFRIAYSSCPHLPLAHFQRFPSASAKHQDNLLSIRTALIVNAVTFLPNRLTLNDERSHPRTSFLPPCHRNDCSARNAFQLPGVIQIYYLKIQLSSYVTLAAVYIGNLARCLPSVFIMWSSLSKSKLFVRVELRLFIKLNLWIGISAIRNGDL